MPQIARELGVDALIEGTVLRAGGRVRITAQLVHGPQDRHLWSECFERELSDMLVVQADIARAVADAVAATVTLDEASRLSRTRPIDPAAYDAYLKGRFFWRQRTREGLLRSVEYYRKATDIEPAFALAHAAAAESLGPLGYLGYLPPHESTPAMRAAATRALEIDPDSVEALTAIAACESFHEWQWRDAEAHFRRAITVNPNYSTAYLWYALLLDIEGRFDESLASKRKGLDLDPWYLRARAEVGWGLFQAGRGDEAFAELRGILELEPDYFFARRHLAVIDVSAGRFAAAIAGFEAVGDEGGMGHALAAAGRVEEARAALTRLEQESERHYVSPVRHALVHLGLGDAEAALASLERAFELRAIDLAAVRVDPRFAPLRGESRFRTLIARMNLP
jgi:tetratricopeptide (TPR) repeat protein